MKLELLLSTFAVATLAFAVAVSDAPAPKVAADIAEPATPISDVAPDESPACPFTRPGGRPGGNNASCRFPCVRFDIVEVSVQSADTVPVSGSGSCGGAGAMCSGEAHCTGISKKWASSNDLKGRCSGASDELWASTLTISCEANPGCTNPLWCVDDAAGTDFYQDPPEEGDGEGGE